MADTLIAGTPRRLLVDGRNPFADEVITTSGNITVADPDADGNVFVSAADGAVDQDTATVTVAPGSEDTGRSEGSDDITIGVPAAPTPLAVTLE